MRIQIDWDPETSVDSKNTLQRQFENPTKLTIGNMTHMDGEGSSSKFFYHPTAQQLRRGMVKKF